MTTKKKKTTKKNGAKKQKAYQKPKDEGNTVNLSITDLMVINSGRRGFEDVDESDIIVPRLTILQGLSPAVMEDSDTYKPGMLINNLSREILCNADEEIYVQFISFRKNRIAWIPRDEGGGMRCMSIDSKKGTSGEFVGRECRTCSLSQWGKNSEPPECTMYYNFPLVYYGPDVDEDTKVIDAKSYSPQLLWIAFGNTSFAVGKKLVNSLRMLNEDIFNRFIVLSSEKTKNDKGVFFIPLSRVGPQVPESVKEIGERAYKFISEMRDKFKFQDDVNDEAAVQEDDNDEL